MNRFGNLATGVVAIVGVLVSSAAHSDEPSGFALEPFQPGYPGSTMIYEGEAAKRLAAELLPGAAEQTSRVLVHESVLLPFGAYQGLQIEIVLAPRAVFGSVCEEPRAFVDMQYALGTIYPREMKAVVSAGRIASHVLNEVRWGGRYRHMPAQSSSPERALEICRELAADTSKWKSANDLGEFRRQERLLVMLQEVVRSPQSPVQCIGVDKKPCGLTRAEIMSLLEKTPPDDAQSLYIPGDGMVVVFRYSERAADGAMAKGYSIAMRPRPEGRGTLRLEFSRDPRPVI